MPELLHASHPSLSSHHFSPPLRLSLSHTFSSLPLLLSSPSPLFPFSSLPLLLSSPSPLFPFSSLPLPSMTSIIRFSPSSHPLAALQERHVTLRQRLLG
ncbi:unnamed protein product [Closterium sp. Naga37s-1]|nr:unnamed protein product [Closterium sp. Naga37s-1]